MKEAILVINSGSSSIKYCLYTAASLDIMERGVIVRVNKSPLLHIHESSAMTGSPLELDGGANGHQGALEWLLQHISSTFASVRIRCVGHRIVHGGLDYSAPQIVDETAMSKLRALTPLAPGHQPHNLAGIETVRSKWPNMMQVACFDTAFHRDQPRIAQLFALPRTLTDEGVIRYGFHGLSYQLIADVLPDHVGERANQKVVAAHLGHGSSLCAMSDRRSIATTMGFTTMDGLMMAKRCGALDPGVILFLMEQKQLSPSEIATLLNERSGLLGVSDLSDDMEILLRSKDKKAQEAVELFVYRAVREIGSLIAALGGLDILVFTGGIGENAPEIRERICRGFDWAGISIAPSANAQNETHVGENGAAVDVLVIPSNEEIVIARAVNRLLHD